MHIFTSEQFQERLLHYISGCHGDGHKQSLRCAGHIEENVKKYLITSLQSNWLFKDP